MADQIITLTIPEAKAAKALEGFLAIYPNKETIPDPKWIDPKDGSEAPQIPRYTDREWVKEQVRRLIVRDIHRGLQMKANQAAAVARDDSMITL